MKPSQGTGKHSNPNDQTSHPNHDQISYSICRLAEVFGCVHFPGNGRLSAPQSDGQVPVDAFGRDRTQRAPALGRVPRGYRHDRKRRTGRQRIAGENEEIVSSVVDWLVHLEKDWNSRPKSHGDEESDI